MDLNKFLMNEIRIRVYRFTSKAEDETVYRNTVKIPFGVQFDYDNMVRCLSVLYPSSMIEFSQHSV